MVLYYNSPNMRISSKNRDDIEYFKFKLINKFTNEEWNFIHNFFTNIYSLNDKKYIYNFYFEVNYLNFASQISGITKCISIINNDKTLAEKRLLEIVIYINKDHEALTKFMNYLISNAGLITKVSFKNL